MADARISVMGPITPEKLAQLKEFVERLDLHIDPSHSAYTYTGNPDELKLVNLAGRVATSLTTLDEFQMAAIRANPYRWNRIEDQVTKLCGPSAFGLHEMTAQTFFREAFAIFEQDCSWRVPTEIVREMMRCRIPFADISPHEHFLNPIRYFDLPKRAALMGSGISHMEFFAFIPASSFAKIRSITAKAVQELRETVEVHQFEMMP